MITKCITAENGLFSKWTLTKLIKDRYNPGCCADFYNA